MWLCILLLVTLNVAITDGQYTRGDMHYIVKHIQTMVMRQQRFPGFPEQGHRQYGVILLLPPKTQNQPQIELEGPAQLIWNYREYMLLGGNFAVARPHGNFEFHTETQLLNHLKGPCRYGNKAGVPAANGTTSLVTSYWLTP